MMTNVDAANRTTSIECPTKALTLLLAAFAAALAMAPGEAQACGGTFCDAGPNAMPVPQTGENILFAMGEGFTEAHIQIQYDPNTEANQFAWVVPMTAVPTFSVGSQRLFDNVLQGTVPAYGFNRQFDDCGGDGSGEAGGDGDTAAGGDSTGGTDPTGGPTVVLETTVGAFEIAVLDGGTAEEVMAWLGENGYQQDPAAEPILADYLAENYLFAAFKLTNGADTAEIHPIALRFEHEEACVPLRLTRIAAVDDMEIRTFFLADARVVPQNYKHVVVNPLMLDWPNFASNYKDVITMAVDAFEADGKAFVTEYAGTSGVVGRDGIYSASWDASAFIDLPVIEVVDTLYGQGLGECDEFEGTCGWRHTLIPGLLAQFLPAPDGVDSTAFYDCLECYEEQIDLATWGDGSAFAAALQERVIDPGAHANEMLDTYATLTRMYTTISPAEMTADPFFWENPALPEVVLTQSIATRRTLCNGDGLWTLPDGREVYVPNDGSWPVFGDEMPWELEVAQIPNNGAPLALVDNGALIDAQLATYNCNLGWPANLCGSNGEGTGGPSDTGGSSPTSGIDSFGDDGSEGSGSGSGSAGADGDAAGCGCTSDPGDRKLASWALAVVAMVVGPRRRGSTRAA